MLLLQPQVCESGTLGDPHKFRNQICFVKIFNTYFVLWGGGFPATRHLWRSKDNFAGVCSYLSQYGSLGSLGLCVET